MSVPELDSKLLPFAQNFHAQIAELPARFNLVGEDVTALETVLNPYVSAANACLVPGAKSKSMVAERQAMKLALMPVLRSLYGRIQESISVSNADKISVGVVVRKAPEPVGVPAESPVLHIGKRYGTTIELIAHSAEGKRTRPANAKTLSVFAHVGPTPPTDPSQWLFRGTSTRTKLEVSFGSEVPPGTTVWFVAYWSNPRGESGAPSAAFPAVIAGGSAELLAA